MGIFHGVWWYYFLSIPYLLFNGSPLGFVFFIFLLSLVQVFLFYSFLKKKIGVLPSFIFLLLITYSSYFISTSFFAISSIFVLPFILLLLYATYQCIDTHRIRYQFLIFLSLGFIFESEVSFGIFIIPSYFLSILVTKQISKFFAKKSRVIYSFIALLIPILPRIFFEVRHNFIQTRTALTFLTKPHMFSSKSFEAVFSERLQLFLMYYKSLFFDHIFLSLIFLCVTLIGFFYSFKKLKHSHKKYMFFVIMLLFFLFLTSLLYKDNFWVNYYEGLPYFYLVLISMSLYALSKSRSKIITSIPFVIFILLLVIMGQKIYKELTNKNKISESGLRSHIQVFDYLYAQNKNQPFCVRIYTPPVIPYTYNYLFNYYQRVKKYPAVSTEYVDRHCWYIVEKEQDSGGYNDRIIRWRSENISSSARLIKTKIMDSGTRVEYWEEK